MKIKVNNYEAATILDMFNDVYISDLNNRIELLEGRLLDSHEWKYGEREKVGYRLTDMKKAYDFYKKMYTAFKRLITQHEAITTDLVQIYRDWYKNVSEDGKQPSEMMEEQAAILQGFFVKIYGYIEEIVKDDLKAPNDEKINI